MSKRLYLLCASLLPLMICTGMIYSIFALYVEELGASRSQIGFLFMASAAVGTVAAPLFGRLSDRMRRRKPIITFSMFAFLVIFVVYALSKSYIEIFPAHAFEGAAWAALGAVAPALIADITPEEERGRAMGIYNTTWNLGWIIGPALGGFLAENFGFRLCFLSCSLMITLGLVLVILFVEEA
ncbi:MAG: putative arabinose efflux permease AraJ [Candidatus Alkanophagales archaeon MCA70_species_2]|nr:putative arabinose efflux permease AraJ [Candidatus Alkanophaga liquidiphilum]RLG35725.1 MAG: MFS transporter [Candidatus Alkanophagales archaeon]